MRPLLARAHLGIGRRYVSAGDRDRAEDHFLAATRLFITMDMPFWLRRVVSSLSQLGSLLIVAGEYRGLYEYLSRVLDRDGPMRIVLAPPGCDAGNHDEGRRQHIADMLQSHGLSIAGSD